jgi:hypothetical protein
MVEKSEVGGNENGHLGDKLASGPSQRIIEEEKGSHEQVANEERSNQEIPREEGQPASSPSSAAASSIPSTTVASLIQSAAKISMLDLSRLEARRHSSNNKQTKLFQDDEYDNLESPSLQSLQKKLLPAMPDEQDRKRFVVS